MVVSILPQEIEIITAVCNKLYTTDNPNFEYGCNMHTLCLAGDYQVLPECEEG